MTIQAAFQAFHLQNPHIYGLLVDLARRTQAKGFRKFGMKALFEILRWEVGPSTDGSEFLLNNNFTALYSRLVMQQERDLQGFFEVRRAAGPLVQDDDSGQDIERMMETLAF